MDRLLLDVLLILFPFKLIFEIWYQLYTDHVREWEMGWELWQHK